MANPQDQAALTMAALGAVKPVGERQPEAGWVGGPAETTAAVHEHRPVCLRRLRSYCVRWMSAPASPVKPDYQHQQITYTEESGALLLILDDETHDLARTDITK